MAERVLFISWGHPIPGRERQGLDVFNQTLAYFDGLAKAGRVERCDTVILEPNAGPNGFIAVQGTHAQIDALREEDRFMRLMIEAGMMVEGLCHVEGYTGTGLAQTMPLYQEATTHVPQVAMA